MERDGNFQLLRMVFGLDPVDFSSIKRFISQPFRYFVLLVRLPNVICFEKKLLETRGFNRPIYSYGLFS